MSHDKDVQEVLDELVQEAQDAVVELLAKSDKFDHLVGVVRSRMFPSYDDSICSQELQDEITGCVYHTVLGGLSEPAQAGLTWAVGVVPWRSH